MKRLILIVSFLLIELLQKFKRKKKSIWEL